MTLNRYADMLAEHGMRPFHREPWINPTTGQADARVLGERPRMRWRVSRDEWDRLCDATRQCFGWALLDEETQYLGGFPISPDDTLPPGTILFEPLSAT